MTKTIVSASNSTYKLFTSNEVYDFKPGANINATGVGIYDAANFDGAQIVVDSKIKVDAGFWGPATAPANSTSIGILAEGDNVGITLKKDNSAVLGMINADIGIKTIGEADNALVYGQIQALSLGAGLYGDASRISVYGTVYGKTGIDIGGNGSAANVGNAGVVTGTDIGIHSVTHAGQATDIRIMSGGTVQVLGTPGMTYVSDRAIVGEGGQEHVVNNGHVIGSIYLGAQADIYEGSGSVTGKIYGGTGNDLLITSKSTIQMVEYANQGTDTVKSSVSYTLNDNIENLILTCKTKAYGVGNDGQNVIIGGDGTNILYGQGDNDFIGGGKGADRLFGEEGDDRLNGQQGNDSLIGGPGHDKFEFTKGGGEDRIIDFKHGEDQIFMTAAGGATNFAALLNATTNDAEGAVIKYDGGLIHVLNVFKGELKVDDFVF